MFREILSQTPDTLYNYIIDKLKEFGYNDIVSQKEQLFIATKGTIPIVLIAHLDTVFDKDRVPRNDILICHDADQGIWWSPHGLGADDKAGIMMILKILENTNLRPHILFTVGEETDARGATAAAELCKEYFKPISYVVELDRQGYKECVFYDCNNPAFEEYINGFGFETHHGTFTDISIICPEWGIAGVNLSVGYYWEHSYMEHFFEYAWKDTYKKVITMLETKCDKIWKYIPLEKKKNKEKDNGKGKQRESSSGK